MANITLMGASYTDVPAVVLPQTGGGTVTFYEDTGGASTVATASTTPSSNSTSISFSVSGEPIMFAVQIQASSSGSYISGSSTRYITSVISDGSNAYGTSIYRSGNSGREYYYSTVSFSYSNGTLTVTSPGSSSLGYFRSGYTYRLIYAY